jgi:aspartate/methionine/tyrosine aminotransferase
MPGWRVGYVAYPKALTPSIRKLQDTIPTHVTVLSQKLAKYCIDIDTPLVIV